MGQRRLGRGRGGRGSVLTPRPLHLGPLRAEGYVIRRSGLRWLREDGATCRAGEAVAYCNVGLARTSGPRDAPMPLASEQLDFQAVLSTPVAGRLTHAPKSSRGGFFDMLNWFQLWSAHEAVGAIEPLDAAPGAGTGEGLTARVMLAAGRRASTLSEDRSGLLTGWHDRTRAWRIGGEGPVGTLVSLGVCELSGVIRGDDLSFLELFEAVEGPAQAVFLPDAPLVPSAQVLASQLARTDADRAAMAEDLARTFAAGPVIPEPSDWIHAGATLRALQASPLTDGYEVLGPNGLSKTGPADAVVLSAGAESRMCLRHRRLGYVYQSHAFRLEASGPAFRAWVRANFEPMRRTVDDFKAGYEALLDRIAERRPGLRVLICNQMSTRGGEDIQCYAGLEAGAVASVQDRAVNLMLRDLARERDVDIVDVDAIGAELGGRVSLADGVHHDGAMQAAMRAEILRILDARGVPGFAPARNRAPG